MRWSRQLLRSASTVASGQMAPPAHVTILGVGLTGLSAAHHLRQALPPTTKITLIEASPRFGGWMESKTHEITYLEEQNGAEKTSKVVLEGGPRSVRPKKSAAAAVMLKMIQDISLEDSIVPVLKTSPSARNRYFLNLGTDPPTLQPVTAWSALSPSTLFAGLLEPLGVLSGHKGDESVDSFVRRKFGSGIAALASTGLHGVYAASSTDLSAQAILGSVYKINRDYGSIILGSLWSSIFPSAANKENKWDVDQRWADLGSLGKSAEKWASYGLKGGLQTLTDSLSSTLRDQGVELRSSERVQRLEPTADGAASIKTDKETLSTDHVVSCLSSNTLSSLLARSLPNLTANPSTSVGVVNFVFPRPPSSIHPSAFGYLVPRSSTAQNPAGVLGVVFDSTALPGLGEEEGLTKLTVMMGGPYWSTYPADGSTRPMPTPVHAEELVQSALKHLRKVFPVLQGVEPALVVPHLQKDCIPTFKPGHYDRLRELHMALKDGPWAGKLSLAGASYYGPSVNDCVASAAQVASALGKGDRPTGLEWVQDAM